MLPMFTEWRTDSVMRAQFITSNLFIIYTFIFSSITGNSSQVDRLWPLIPTVHAWLFVYLEYVSNSNLSQNVTLQRLLLISGLITVWCVRLVYNYWRRGGYSVGSEDYRWATVKKWFYYPTYRLPYSIFNLLFISIYQCWLLYSITIPLWYLQRYRSQTETSLNYFDALFGALFLVFLLVETAADQQQWNYQNFKYDWLKTKKNGSNGQFSDVDLKRGFLTKGLFKYSRHPNVFAEQAIWLCVYGFSFAVSFKELVNGGKYDLLWNESVYGALLLSALVNGSTILTEYLTQTKYKEYKLYKASVSRFIPLPFSSYDPKKPY